MPATSACAATAHTERQKSMSAGLRQVSAPAFSCRTSVSSSFLPITRSVSQSRSCNRARSMQLFPLHAQFNLGDVGSEEEGYRPIEDNSQAPVPPRHLEQVIRPPYPPGQETCEP